MKATIIIGFCNLFEQNAIDRNVLQAILERHALTLKWEQFEQKYLAGNS